MERKNHLHYLNRLDFHKGLTILFTVGLVGHAVSLTLPLMKILTPWFLLVCTFIILIQEVTPPNKRFFLWVAITAVITWLLEVAGVATGLIFGHYQYGSVLGFHLAGVPPIIGINWSMVVLGSISLGRVLLPGWKYNIFLAPFAVVLFDVIMEPVAVSLGYWHWFGRDIPVQNYLAWWIITLFLTLMWKIIDVQAKEKLPAWYLTVMFTYFLLMGLYL